MRNLEVSIEHQTYLFALPGEAPHEQVMLGTDHVSGLRAIVAIHSTARGPAFGGCRLWSYADDHAALTDALRLSLGMTLKNALAGLCPMLPAVADGIRNGDLSR